MTSLRISGPFLEMEWKPSEPDRDAAWALYIELLTRIATQPLPEESGDEAAALESIYSLFPTTRAILREYGRGCIEFTKIAIVVLNQIVRPFTTQWHRNSREGRLSDAEVAAAFRDELGDLQARLTTYAQMLAEMAGVENLTGLEKDD